MSMCTSSALCRGTCEAHSEWQASQAELPIPFLGATSATSTTSFPESNKWKYEFPKRNSSMHDKSVVVCLRSGSLISTECNVGMKALGGSWSWFSKSNPCVILSAQRIHPPLIPLNICMCVYVYIYMVQRCQPPPSPPMVMGQTSTPPLWLWSCGWVVVV